MITTQIMLTSSTIYRDFLEERDEILKHKWYESEKAGYDIGFDKALMEWVIRHRSNWRSAKKTHNLSSYNVPF
jgi:hypothetical protein